MAEQGGGFSKEIGGACPKEEGKGVTGSISQILSINRKSIFCSDSECSPLLAFCSISLRRHLFHFGILNWSQGCRTSTINITERKKGKERERPLVTAALAVIVKSPYFCLLSGS